jgi:hypothetical protein
MTWNELPELPPPLHPKYPEGTSVDVLIVANGRYYVAYYDYEVGAWYTDNSVGDRSVVESLNTGVECWAELTAVEVVTHNRAMGIT